MNWKINLLASALLLFISCKKEIQETTPITNTVNLPEATSYMNTNHLIEAEELQKLIGKPDIKVVHFGREKQYKEGHIEGSVNIWRTDIEDASYPYKGMMCSKEQLEKLCSHLGIKNSDTIVVYDQVASCDAARLWWVLKNYGFHNLKILNGGMKSWLAIDGKLEQGIKASEQSNFVLPKTVTMPLYLSKEDMLAAIGKSTTPLILDTRTVNEYIGLRQKQGAKVSGRIPGSTLMDWASCVNYDGDQKFKGYEELAAMYAAIIPDKEQSVVVYCHSGVRSAHTTFVLTELLGYKNVRNYDGSWIEWSQFEKYPKERDSIPTILQ